MGQAKAETAEITYKKENLTDLFVEHPGRGEVDRHMNTFEQRLAEHRATSSLSIHSFS